LNSKAEAAVARALEIEPQNLDAQKLRLSLMLTFHRFDEALAAAKPDAAESCAGRIFSTRVLTDAHVELGNYAEARSGSAMVDLRPEYGILRTRLFVRSLYGDANGASKR
jgi:hypothetical protein